MQLLKCPTVLPDKYICKLSFATAGTFITTGVMSHQVIVATQTSPWGTSVNPQGWDQLANMYLRWRPLGMSLKTTFGIVTHGITLASCNYRGYWSQYSTAVGSDLAIIQNRFTKTKDITTQDGFVTVSTYSPLHDVWGMTKEQWINDENTQASVDSNPFRVTRYYMNFNCPDWETGGNYRIRYEILGDMYVEFYGARILVDA